MELETNLDKLFLVQNEELKNTAYNDKIDYNAPEWKELYEYERKQSLIPPSPNNPPWNSWIAIVLWIFSVLLIIFLPFLFVIPYAASQNINLADAQMLADFLKNSPTAILLNVIAIFPAHFFTLLVAWFVVTKNKTYSFRQTLGWSSGNFRWFYYILILVGFFAIAGVVNYLMPNKGNELERILQSSRTAVFIVAFLATFTAPLVEEVIYRGILYSAFQRSIGRAGAVVIVTALFALVHVPQYWGSPGTIFLICLLSLVLTLVRVKSDNLLPCVILHTIFNGLQSLFLVLEPYLPKDLKPLEEQAAAILHIFK